MQKIKKVLMGVAALAALALGGAAIANATGGGESSDAPDQAVTGTASQKAGGAARQAVGGGTVVSVERSDEGDSTYEVKVANGGKVHEVQVDDAYHATGQKLDDDQPGAQHEQGDQGDGDGETNDD